MIKLVFYARLVNAVNGVHTASMEPVGLMEKTIIR